MLLNTHLLTLPKTSYFKKKKINFILIKFEISISLKYSGSANNIVHSNNYFSNYKKVVLFLIEHMF